MRVPLSWLRDFAPVPGETDALVSAFNELGLVVDGVDEIGRGLEDVVIARVLDIRAISGADRIRLVDLDAGGGDAVEVVCGAWNFAGGDLVPLAPVGAVLPGGFEIGRRKMKGVWSNGMICSGRELGLNEDHEGILVLPAADGVRPGAPLTEALGIEADVVFDLDITPNRPDAMSVGGVARDLAAKLRVPFALPDPPAVPAGLPLVELDATDLCPRFSTSVLDGVRVGPSPRWLASRVTLAGMRPISNLVDVSNYVMLELGQPNHPYDLERLRGGGLRVRRARTGETLETLDDVTRELGEDDCLICDAEDQPVGIGGIMGGASAEISESTSTVLLEAAYFTPMAIARTSKRLALRTEASARFERGVDPEGIERAVARFADLAAVVAGTTAADLGVAGEAPPRTRVRVRAPRVNKVLGTSLSADEIASYLTPIGFSSTPVDERTLDVEIPSWRPDSEREIDVIEEVARHHGYERIPRTMPPVQRVGSLTPYQRDRRRVRDVLAGAGLSEAWTNSFIAPTDLERAGLPVDAVEVENPLAAEESILRTSMLPGLLKALAYNASHRNPDVRLFEVGRVFALPRGGEDLPDERERVSIALAGGDAADAKRLVDLLAAALRLADVTVAAAGEVAGLHPTRAAAVRSGGAELGVAGEVDPEVVVAHGLEGRVGWVDLDLGLLLASPRRPESYRPVSRFPSSDIDLAFEVPDDVPADAVARTLREVGGDLLVTLELFDVYRGGRLRDDVRSLAFRLRFNALDRTLTDEEVAAVRRRCIEAVERAHDSSLRG